MTAARIKPTLKYKPLYPWTGGLNVSQDPIILDPNFLIQADNIEFTSSQSRKKRGGQKYYNSATLSGASTANMVYFTNYWATVSNNKREYFVTIADNGKVYRNAPGTTLFSSFSTLALTVGQGLVTTSVIQNDLIIGIKGNGVPKVWKSQSTTANLVSMTASTGTLPFSNAWITKPFIERLFVANGDTLDFSATGNYTNWTTGTAAGRAGSLIIGSGDNDPSGITAIFPGVGYNRVLYVGKRSHLYAVNCSDPNQNNWSVTLVTAELGVINPNAVCNIDETDVCFASDRGVHSIMQVLQTTAVLPSQFLSYDIQDDYNFTINPANRQQITLQYMPSLNSIFLSCKRNGFTTYETIYGYNVLFKQWFRWTNTPCNFIFKRLNITTGFDELYGCAPLGRLTLLNQTLQNDFGSAITTTLVSSFIYPEQLPFLEYNFTRLFLIFRSRDNATFSLSTSIDGIVSKAYTIQERFVGGNILGTTALGPSFLLGSIQSIKPYGIDLNGVGSSIQLTITHNTINTDFEMFGAILEYDSAGDRQNPYNADAYN